MTISYSRKVSSTKLGRFLWLLCRWRGSIYRLLYREFLIYLACYFGLASVYRFALNDGQKAVFEHVALYFEKYAHTIPLTFVLGFYVSLIVGRWWKIFQSFAWPDKVACFIACFIKGSDQRSLYVKKTMVRYLNLCHVLILRDISQPVINRYPTVDSLVAAGYMTDEELRLYETLGTGLDYHIHNFWIPWQWTCTLACVCRRQGQVDSDPILCKIFDAILNYRNSLSDLIAYDWITVPLVYTQVVTIAVYSYFIASLMGRQYLDPAKKYEGYAVDLYFPFVTVVEFFFYMGWLKVAESIINPLGDDDEDFDTLKIIGRNFEVGNMIIDQNCMRMPVFKEKFYDVVPESKFNMSQTSVDILKTCSVTDEILIKYDISENALRKHEPDDEIEACALSEKALEKDAVEKPDDGYRDSVLMMEQKQSVKL